MPKKIIILSALCAVALPLFVSAHTPDVFSVPPGFWGPLVSCGPGFPNACASLCDLVHTGVHILYFVISLTLFLIGPIAVAVGGVMILVGGANPSLLSAGKKTAVSGIIGMAIVLAGFVVVNTFFQILGVTGVRNWSNFDCSSVSALSPVALGPAGAPPTAPPGGGAPTPTSTQTQDPCLDPQALAVKNKVPYPARNSPALESLIACVLSQESSDPLVRGLIDQNQKYTFELTNDLCNYTRGQPICGTCAHSRYSCHYGGAPGTGPTDGSHGVDFNAVGGSFSEEQRLNTWLKKIAPICGYSLGSMLFERSGSSFHTHISSPLCRGY